MAKVERTDAQLVISENPAVLWGLLLVAGAGLLIGVVAAFWDGPLERGKLVGWTLGSLMCFVAAGAAERSRFVFDLENRVLTWERRKLLRSPSGRVAFTDITDVVLETRGDTEGTTYRALIVTKTGTVPLPGFDHDRVRQAELAETVLEALTLDPNRLFENSVAQLARSGDTVSAVTLAREHYGLGTTQAHALARAEARKTGKP